MTVFENLQEASFKGFAFLVNTESNASGKKVVVHEYPNSDKRFVEELGQVPSTFTLNAIVHGDINLRNRLEQLLREPGTGTLVHPVYGIIDVMAGDYSVASNQRSVGEFNFSIVFYVTEQNITASVDTAAISQITAAVDTMRESTSTAFKAIYTAPTTADNFNDANAKVTAFFTAIEQSVNTITEPVTKNIESFNTLVDAALSGVSTLVQDAESLSEAIDSVFVSAANVANTPADLLDTWKSLTTFGNDDDTLSNTTVKRQELIDNRAALNDVIQINALGGQFESASFKSYRTDTELAEEQASLNDAFGTIVVDRITSTELQRSKLIALDSDVREAVHNVRDISRKIFEGVAQNVWRVVDIDQNKSTMMLTAYRYYGDLSTINLLSDLNPDVNHAGFAGTIKGLSE